MSDGRTGAGVDEQQMLRLAKILSDPLRVDIVCECNISELSPRSFRQKFGGPSLANIQQAFMELEQYGWLERASDPGQQFSEELDRPFRATSGAVFDEPIWSALPDSVRSLMTLRFFESLTRRFKDATKAGTIDARKDRHLTWTGLRLDQQGWETVVGRVDALFHSLAEERERAEARLAESGEEPILTTVALLAFESPRH